MIHKYRIEAGTGSNAIVGQVDVQDGRIVAAPHIWAKFKGQELHRLQWWLAAKMHTVFIERMPNLEDPESEHKHGFQQKGAAK